MIKKKTAIKMAANKRKKVTNNINIFILKETDFLSIGIWLLMYYLQWVDMKSGKLTNHFSSPRMANHSYLNDVIVICVNLC